MGRENNPAPAPAVKSGLFYGFKIAIAAFVIIFVVFGIRFSYGVFFIPMAQELGLNAATVSLAYSLSMVVEGIFNIITGGMTDKYGPRIVLMFSGIFIALGYFLMPLVQTTWQLFLFYSVIIGIGSGGIFVPLVVVVTHWFKARRSLMTGIVLSGIGLGMVVMAPVNTQLIQATSWKMTFLLTGILILVVCLVAAQFLKLDPSSMGLLPYGESPDTARGGRGPLGGLSFREAFRTYQFWFVVLMLLCFGFSTGAVNVHIVPDAINHGISSAVAAVILSTAGGLQVVGRVGLGIVADRIGNRRIYLIGFTLIALSLFWITFKTETWAFFLFAAVLGLASGGLGSSQSPIVAGLFGLKSHGLIFGFCGFGFTLGVALGPYISGHIFDVTGNYSLAFIISAIITIAGLILTFLLRPLKNTNWGNAYPQPGSR
jgi:MFS family permease